MKRLLITLVLAVPLCSACNGIIGVSAFTKSSEIRLTVGGEDVFVYDEAFCQLGLNSDKCEFRVHSDTMSDYFTVTLDRIPTEKGSPVTASIRWSTEDSELVRNNVALNTVKVEGDRIWLWNNPSKTGVVLRLLE